MLSVSNVFQGVELPQRNKMCRIEGDFAGLFGPNSPSWILVKEPGHQSSQALLAEDSHGLQPLKHQKSEEPTEDAPARLQREYWWMVETPAEATAKRLQMAHRADTHPCTSAAIQNANSTATAINKRPPRSKISKKNIYWPKNTSLRPFPALAGVSFKASMMDFLKSIPSCSLALSFERCMSSGGCPDRHSRYNK